MSRGQSGSSGEARRPLVLSGRGALGAGAELVQFLDRTGAVYIDTQESRNIVPAEHASVVGAVRAKAMQEADVVIVVGRKLDYQTAYGSPVAFPSARFIRIGDNWEELRENRRGEVELFAHPATALAALSQAIAAPSSQLDTAWTAMLRAEHTRRATKYAESLGSAPPGKDGHMHPNRIFAALHATLRPDAITIADGGDILSFARMGLPQRTYLDSGTFGCLGVGVPYGVAAALLHPDRQVVVVTGDGAFGINAMEIDSAKRHGAKVVFIVANNAAWNIERLDQEMNYGGRVVGTTLQWSDYAAMARAFGLHAERVTDPARLACRPRRGVRESAGAARRRRHAARAVVGRRQGIGLGPGLPGAHVVGRRGARPPPAVSHLLTVADVVAAQARLQPDKVARPRLAPHAYVRAVERARDAPRQRAR